MSQWAPIPPMYPCCSPLDGYLAKIDRPVLNTVSEIWQVINKHFNSQKMLEISAHSVPGTLQGTLHVLTNLIIASTKRGKH